MAAVEIREAGLAWLVPEQRCLRRLTGLSFRSIELTGRNPPDLFVELLPPPSAPTELCSQSSDMLPASGVETLRLASYTSNIAFQTLNPHWPIEGALLPRNIRRLRTAQICLRCIGRGGHGVSASSDPHDGGSTVIWQQEVIFSSLVHVVRAPRSPQPPPSTPYIGLHPTSTPVSHPSTRLAPFSILYDPLRTLTHRSSTLPPPTAIHCDRTLFYLTRVSALPACLPHACLVFLAWSLVVMHAHACRSCVT